MSRDALEQKSTVRKNEAEESYPTMVAKGSLGKYTPGKPSTLRYQVTVAALIIFSLAGGYYAGTAAKGEWSFFAWHPMLMTCGMVGLAGIGAMTKKLGGYNNTKLHGMMGSGSVLLSCAGVYCIYLNKERNGYGHLKSQHSIAGVGVLCSCIALGMAGGVFLHPDFGVDKTNKTIRLGHKMASRIVLMLAWFTAFSGLQQMMPDKGLMLLPFGIPLLILAPFVLL